MRTYILRVVCRQQDGIVGPTLDERTITAADDDAAVAMARDLDLDFHALGANAVYLVVPDGRTIWSLHAPNPCSNS